MRESSKADPELRPSVPPSEERRYLQLHKGETVTFDLRTEYGLNLSLLIAVDDIVIRDGVPCVRMSYPSQWWSHSK